MSTCLFHPQKKQYTMPSSFVSWNTNHKLMGLEIIGCLYLIFFDKSSKHHHHPVFCSTYQPWVWFIEIVKTNKNVFTTDLTLNKFFLFLIPWESWTCLIFFCFRFQTKHKWWTWLMQLYSITFHFLLELCNNHYQNMFVYYKQTDIRTCLFWDQKMRKKQGRSIELYMNLFNYKTKNDPQFAKFLPYYQL